MTPRPAIEPRGLRREDGARLVALRYSPVPVFGFSLSNEALFSLQGKRCFICGFKMKRGLTREHVWPRSLGGREAGNVLLAHQLCNMRKADRMPTPCELLFRDAIYRTAQARHYAP